MAAKKNTKKDPSEVVVMTHPSIGVNATARRSAFEGVWKSKGWKEASKSDAEAFLSGAPVISGTAGTSPE